MTIHDQNLRMADDRRIGIAELKAHLSAQLRLVEEGESIVVLNHKRPVARIVPYEEEPEWKRWARQPEIPGHFGEWWAEMRANRKPAGEGVAQRALEILLEDRRKR